MKLNYINKIKANISIYSTKKTTNILDGTYKSVYKGKSMNFENLREYVINDDIKDIDWKSSARSGTLLVKQFVAEKKHNILLVLDSGSKMNADTDMHQEKKDIAMYLAGTVGYLAIKNGDYVGMCYQEEKTIFKPFKEKLYNLEEYLCSYDHIKHQTNSNINSTLEYICKNIKKRMIVFIITDIKGLDEIEEKNLKKLKQIHDVLIINIKDNNMIGNNIFDIDNNEYIPKMLLNDEKLLRLEKEIKKTLLENNQQKLKKTGICMTEISCLEEINTKIIKLLEEHKYANNN